MIISCKLYSFFFTFLELHLVHSPCATKSLFAQGDTCLSILCRWSYLHGKDQLSILLLNGRILPPTCLQDLIPIFVTSIAAFSHRQAGELTGSAASSMDSVSGLERHYFTRLEEHSFLRAWFSSICYLHQLESIPSSLLRQSLLKSFSTISVKSLLYLFRTFQACSVSQPKLLDRSIHSSGIFSMTALLFAVTNSINFRLFLTVSIVTISSRPGSLSNISLQR